MLMTNASYYKVLCDPEVKGFAN